jgi:GntR family transcriptional regulator
MKLDLDPRDPLPLYLQLAAAVRRAVALGALRPGDRVPTVRELAVRARVNRNTAGRAIQHLESEGIVRTRVGQGTFVEDGAARGDRQTRDAALDLAFDRVVLEAHGAGIPLEELGWRLSRRIEAFRRQRDRGKWSSPDMDR